VHVLLQSAPPDVFERTGEPDTHGPQGSTEPPVVFAVEQYLTAALQELISVAAHFTSLTHDGTSIAVQNTGAAQVSS